jgi:hypothetical protein
MRKDQFFNKRLYIIYILSAVIAIAIAASEGICIVWDSTSYIDAWNSLYFYVRTPVYPLLIGLMKIILGNGFLWGVVVVQNMLFLLSLPYLYDLLEWVTSSDRIAFWLTLLYGIHPGILCWNNYIMTEYLAIILIIFIAWEIKAILCGGSWKSALLFTFYSPCLSFSVLRRFISCLSC